ncbi:MAG: hypothetical protein D6729_11580, partial [Deltaproteobacteria bacterium]
MLSRHASRLLAWLLPLLALAAAHADTRQDAASSEPERLVYFGIRPLAGIRPEEVEGLDRLAESEIEARSHYAVVGPRDIETLLSLEAQRQLMGCNADSSCLAEIGGALGASRIVFGDLTRYGPKVLLNLVLLDVESARALARLSRTVDAPDSLAPLLDVLGGAIGELLAGETGETQPTGATTGAGAPPLASAAPPPPAA